MKARFDIAAFRPAAVLSGVASIAPSRAATALNSTLPVQCFPRRSAKWRGQP